MTTPQALAGIRVLDLTRILAGPTCTQLLGDLGADVIKIERPGRRRRHPQMGPALSSRARTAPTRARAPITSAPTATSARSRSTSPSPDGQALVRRLLTRCDVLVENFKVGDLARYGLDYEQLKAAVPGLVYCSITGFGQTGPYAPRAGYDYPGPGHGRDHEHHRRAADGAADEGGRRHRRPDVRDVRRRRRSWRRCVIATRTGEGQHIDLALLDTQVAWLVNEGTNYLVSGEVPQPARQRASQHRALQDVREQPTATSSWRSATTASSRSGAGSPAPPELAADPRFATNSLRVRHRARALCADAGTGSGARPRRTGSTGWRLGRAVRPGQQHRPGVRGPAGAGARHADRGAARDGRRRHRAADRQPDPDGGPRPPTATARRRWASTPTRCWPSCCSWTPPSVTSCARPARSAELPAARLPPGLKNSRSRCRGGVAAIPP